MAKTIYYATKKQFDKIVNSTNDREQWEAICDFTEDNHIPYLAGGLDHIKETKKQIIVYDIGCNQADNSFIIRKG